MTEPAILVLTTVHHPDDTRIRERLIRTLDGVGSVSYASREPGPSDRSGIHWLPLQGGRLRRNGRAVRLLLAHRWHVAVLHDPELIPAGALARLVRRAPVVFDVHEDLAAQIPSKEWVPVWARPVFVWLARTLYRLAERSLVLTLAEPGYRRLFRNDHPVFPNHPRTDGYPDPLPSGDGSAAYVGDITRARGIEDALAACDKAGVTLVAVGRVDEALAGELRRKEPTVTLTGALSNPEAMLRVSKVSVGLSPLRDEPNYRNSLPTKTLEYLAMGVPVVATDLPGTKSVLDGLDAVWLVPAGNVPAMAQAISNAMGSEAKAAAFRQAPAIRTRFRWPEDEVRSFYLGLLNRGRSPAPS